MLSSQLLAISFAAAMVAMAQSASLESTSATTTYRRIPVDGVDIFYREAGSSPTPTIVLLPGFPSSSREFDWLIPLLATHYHVVAPDFPGFGQSEAAPPSSYAYTFGPLAGATSRSRRPTSRPSEKGGRLPPARTRTRSIIWPRRLPASLSNLALSDTHCT